jgi:5'-nucleotidase
VATSRRLRALITNDDGIDSPGLWALAGCALDAGFDVVIAAPQVDASGVGASVHAQRDPDGGVRVVPRTSPALPGIPAYGVAGHPAFIVHAAGRGWLDPVPDLVLSGINLGANVGHSVLHSGTIGAVLAASLHGWRGLAVSLDTGLVAPPQPHWEAVARVLPEVLDVLLATPAGTMLSLNVPDRPADELAVLREARLARFADLQVLVEHRAGVDGGSLHATIRSATNAPEPGSDMALLRAGHPTLTELHTIRHVPGVLPDRRAARQPAG